MPRPFSAAALAVLLALGIAGPAQPAGPDDIADRGFVEAACKMWPWMCPRG